MPSEYVGKLYSYSNLYSSNTHHVFKITNVHVQTDEYLVIDLELVGVYTQGIFKQMPKQKFYGEKHDIRYLNFLDNIPEECKYWDVCYKIKQMQQRRKDKGYAF